MHFDVVVAVGPSVVPTEMGGTKPERRAARERLRPSFEAILAHFQGEAPLSLVQPGPTIDDTERIPMAVIQKVVVSTEVGAAELAAGVAYVHDYELDGDEDLQLEQRVEILDGGGRYHAATVVERVEPRWKLRIQP